MPRPKKVLAHCRRLAASASAAAASNQRSRSIDTSDEVESEVLEEFYDSSESLSDEDIPMMMVHHEISTDAFMDSISNSDNLSLLVWKDGAGSSLRPVYTGNSRTTLWRKEVKKRKRHESVENIPKITTFFTATSVQTRSRLMTVDVALQLLNQECTITPKILRQKQNGSTSNWELQRKLSVRHYLQCLQKKQPKLESSQQIGSFLFPDRSLKHTGELIRYWTEYFLENASLPPLKQGKFAKKKSLIHDEDVQGVLRRFIRTEPQVAVVSTRLSQWVHENLHVELNFASPVSISSRTAQRWLNILGLRFGRFVKGLYTDGHERADVVSYRNAFLERMEIYQKRMVAYVGDFMETSIVPELEDGERPLILVTHDESCFGSNDGRSHCWLDENNRQIRPKGNGRSVMVSAFLCECHGILKLDHELQAKFPNIPADSTELLIPGCNSEGYWKNSDLVEQLKNKAIPIFRVLHPECDGIFMFDNSQNHHAKPPDALSASKMNLTDGGVNQRLMRNGWFHNSNGERIVQSMVLDDGVTSKGVKRVLEERGLWMPRMKIREARKLLSEQEDFRSQKEWLAETVSDAGYLIDYYPKYHCEFNYIEMFWGAAKAWCRANCTFNFNDHLNLVKEALKSVTVCKIRRFARKSYRYMDAYRVKGTDGCSLSTKMIEYAVKKYRGHRVIPHRILETENLFK